MDRAFHIPLTTATAALAGKTDGERFALLGSHGSLTVEIYSPQRLICNNRMIAMNATL